MKFSSIIYQSLIKIYGWLPFKKYICLVLRSLHLNNEKFYRDLTFKGSFTVKLSEKKFKINQFGSTIENEIFWKGLSGGWEKISLSLWIKLCGESNVVFDIGANTGIYSLVAAATNSNTTIYAFEPSQNVLRKFHENINLNRFINIHAFDYAISNRTGAATFYDLEGEHQYSASLNKNMIPDEPSRKEVIVDVKTLDDFIDEHKISKIDLIKIDVEMHEPEVLEGFKIYILRYRPTLIIEILTGEIAARIEEQLKNLGYLYFNIDEINPPKKVEHLSQSDQYNFLICSKEVAELLKLI